MPRQKALATLSDAELLELRSAVEVEKQRRITQATARIAELKGQAVASAAPVRKRGRPAKAAPVGQIRLREGLPPKPKAAKGRKRTGAAAKALKVLAEATKPLSVGEIKQGAGIAEKYNLAATMAVLLTKKRIQRHGSKGSFSYTIAK